MTKIAFQAITKQFPGSNKPAVDAVTLECRKALPVCWWVPPAPVKRPCYAWSIA